MSGFARSHPPCRSFAPASGNDELCSKTENEYRTHSNTDIVSYSSPLVDMFLWVHGHRNLDETFMCLDMPFWWCPFQVPYISRSVRLTHRGLTRFVLWTKARRHLRRFRRHHFVLRPPSLDADPENNPTSKCKSHSCACVRVCSRASDMLGPVLHTVRLEAR